MSPQQAARELDASGEAGLSSAEAQQRLGQYGPNELVERGLKSPWAILAQQLSGLLVIVLILAAVVSGVLGVIEIYGGHSEGWGEIYDAIAIAVIVVLNTILGFTQEYRAERAMAALKKLAVPTVRVRRDGAVQEIKASALVPGDVVLLEAGGVVPADCRLLEAANLRVQEAALTGESEPVEKNPAAAVPADTGLGDRTNMAYMGTICTYGRGTALVTGTGMATELGGIATMLQEVTHEGTPLQKRLEQLGKGLALAALGLVTAIFILGLVRGGLNVPNIKTMFLTAVSMAVAAVPEGLPAVVTIALALGAQRMLKRRALIRKLLAVETLGSVTVICSDKTGTLTENRMTVTILDADGHTLNLREHLSRSGVSAEPSEAPDAILQARPAMAMLLAGGALCSDAALREHGEGAERFSAVGDPTEGALVVAAARMALPKDDLQRLLPRVGELPFDSDRKRMTTIHRLGEGQLPPSLGGLLRGPVGLAPGDMLAITKGAVDSLLAVSDRLWECGGVVAMDAAARQRIAAANDGLAAKGMRVLGLAMRRYEGAPAHAADAESGLVFLGMVGMIDPPRAEVRSAVATCKAAGIRPIMITGDHPLTARHIAHELGIDDGGRTLTGAELARMSPQELSGVVGEVSVYARVSPEHKLAIVQALQGRGHVVAMTGDGVNDAPALKKADIGVAMGITGTDVSKEASDMVLQDDNFATIVAAVEEGRVIYDNIRKFIKYLLATNTGELWVMFLAPIFGMPLPLVPLQILWINLVTDGLPALALGVEPPEADVMRRRPHDPKASIFGGGMLTHIIWVGLLMAVLSLGTAWWYFKVGGNKADVEYFRTMVFTIVTLCQMAHVLAIRTGRQSLFAAGLFSNKPMLGAVLLTIALQLVIVYTPALQGLFETQALSLADLGIAAAVSSVIFWAVEFEKIFQRRRSRRLAV
jgi:Ca2+-transporting ATPase